VFNLVQQIQVHVTQTNDEVVPLIAAIATAVAAMATAWMAWKTRAMATETAKLAVETKEVAVATAKEAKAVEDQGKHIAAQAEASAGALRATVLPWLTWLPERKRVETTRTFSTISDFTVSPPPEVTSTTREPGLVLQPAKNGDGVDGWIWVRNVGAGIALIDTYNSWANRCVSTFLRQIVHRFGESVTSSG